jgi:glycosyltransferase involved in cell wall biosynthesis
MNRQPSKPPASLELLLPTYNGSRYLPELLESLCHQTFSDFSLLTYDDGSNDDTIAIVNKYSDRLRIERVPNPTGNNIGAVKSFSLLMDRTSAECIMFCDQDDIWENTKIEMGITKLAESVKQYGDVPMVIFSDLSLISGSGKDLKTSFLGSMGFNPAALDDPYYLAFRNPAPGCSMTVNKALIDAALPLQTAALMHDWWLMLSASLTGKIIFIDSKLIRYRVHQSNALGVAYDRPLHPLLSMASMLYPKKLYDIVNRFKPVLQQADTVFRVHGRHFSRSLFWCKLIAGRYFFPAFAKVVPSAPKHSWKRVHG